MNSNLQKKLVICDLDNTLYDWVKYFVSSFYSMVDKVVELTDCDREKLLDDFRFVHRKYNDSEHPFALLETRTVKQLFPDLSPKAIANELDLAFYEFNLSRKKTLCAYPGVYDGLTKMNAAGIKLVAYTESNLFAAADRLNRLKLDAFFERIYCRKRASSNHPNPKSKSEWNCRHSLEKFYELPTNIRKPNSKVLHQICEELKSNYLEAAYVGDSVARDILMAKEAGIYSIWARYGTVHSAVDYDRLVRVTHWTQADVIREKKIKEKSKNIRADAILNDNFREILRILHI